MSFPDRYWFGLPRGWQDRGHVEKVDDPNRSGWVTYTCCPICSTRAKVGREECKTFLFCPRCLLKIKL